MLQFNDFLMSVDPELDWGEGDDTEQDQGCTFYILL